MSPSRLNDSNQGELPGLRSKRYQHHAKTPFSMALFDVLWGFVAFVLVMVVCFLYQDIRPFLLATCLAYIGAGFYRAGTLSDGTQPTGTPSKRLLLKASFVAAGGILPAVIMNMLGVALNGPPFLVFFLLACSLDAALGTLLRSLISQEKMKYAILDRSGRLKAVHLGYDSSEHLSQTLSRQIDQLL
ncbi:MAG TPA: hypothetical protein VNZ47_15170 [Candidatus Dormibacteraeota bacterium]|nr:hypothetical protein [Candidatus Dormibacteraeota bacterium]